MFEKFRALDTSVLDNRRASLVRANIVTIVILFLGEQGSCMNYRYARFQILHGVCKWTDCRVSGDYRYVAATPPSEGCYTSDKSVSIQTPTKQRCMRRGCFSLCMSFSNSRSSPETSTVVGGLHNHPCNF